MPIVIRSPGQRVPSRKISPSNTKSLDALLESVQISEWKTSLKYKNSDGVEDNDNFKVYAHDR